VSEATDTLRAVALRLRVVPQARKRMPETAGYLLTDQYAPDDSFQYPHKPCVERKACDHHDLPV
jgi:hypothetical protein